MAVSWEWFDASVDPTTIPATGGTARIDRQFLAGESIQRVILQPGVYNTVLDPALAIDRQFAMPYRARLTVVVGNGVDPNESVIDRHQAVIAQYGLQFGADLISYQATWVLDPAQLTVDVTVRKRMKATGVGLSIILEIARVMTPSALLHEPSQNWMGYCYGRVLRSAPV